MTQSPSPRSARASNAPRRHAPLRVLLLGRFVPSFPARPASRFVPPVSGCGLTGLRLPASRAIAAVVMRPAGPPAGPRSTSSFGGLADVGSLFTLCCGNQPTCWPPTNALRTRSPFRDHVVPSPVQALAGPSCRLGPVRFDSILGRGR